MTCRRYLRSSQQYFANRSPTDCTHKPVIPHLAETLFIVTAMQEYKHRRAVQKYHALRIGQVRAVAYGDVIKVQRH